MPTLAAILCIAMTAVSCEKDTPENRVTIDWNNQAQTTFTTKSDQYEDSVTTFREATVHKTSDIEGKSWFSAGSSGGHVYDSFLLSIYFDDIKNMKVGDELRISRFMFTFFYSSDSNATTYSHGGKIILAEKTDDQVVLLFQGVTFSCSFGDYVTSGYLRCSLLPE